MIMIIMKICQQVVHKIHTTYFDMKENDWRLKTNKNICITTRFIWHYTSLTSDFKSSAPSSLLDSAETAVAAATSSSGLSVCPQLTSASPLSSLLRVCPFSRASDWVSFSRQPSLWVAVLGSPVATSASGEPLLMSFSLLASWGLGDASVSTFLPFSWGNRIPTAKHRDFLHNLRQNVETKHRFHSSLF